jgi:hypothetical protein
MGSMPSRFCFGKFQWLSVIGPCAQFIIEPINENESTLRCGQTSFAGTPQLIGSAPQKSRDYDEQAGKQPDEKPLVLIHEIKNRRDYPTDSATDLKMLAIILGWFAIPAAGIIWWRFNFLIGWWLFGTGLLVLSAMLGLV